jgi:hypothetical protein
MSTIEEQLWDYIDGNCSDIEKAEIEAKIASHLQYNAIYKELLLVQQELLQLDDEEPSLSFTRNVMEQVKLELPPIALKTKVDQRIIYAIGSIFAILIVSVLGFAIAISDLKFSFEMPDFDFSGLTKTIDNPLFLQIFLFVDVMLGLVYLDTVLRKKRAGRGVLPR